ncbi:cyclopropane-fatty-acyl-phospholipid synthase family protein [Caulobacter sp. 17J65-9]|uniref:SAM-dependent methyltransferase n=1 Tax=Caulobacter sp. 17J65-9 TaxID=2709382 RepID=UPI0013CD0040|nr:cyclopropane-fatty-acyl-phospholipid synthase family protein [Caulobacter sp. 17J65-9]NEX94271.1 class I SAM-dependent methyltransferase [Caulobacter sp. 17J65-9]
MLERLLREYVREGSAAFSLPDGRRLVIGDDPDPSVAVRLADWATVRRIAAKPALAVGEAFMDGGLIMERGSIYDLVDLVARRPMQPLGLLGRIRARMDQANDRRASRQNVAHHYDLSYDLYRRFLDQDMQYSCAVFERPDMSLEEAQAAKKRRLAAKLLLQPGMRVLDIGCGWGGLALTLAELGAEVVGVTLSQEQLAIARERAEERGLSNRVRFELCDYRDVQGPFDRIISVGMFEHVGVPNFPAYFEAVSRLLTDDGVAVIHSIGRKDGPGATQPWIAKYIFPGGYIPALSEVLPSIEPTGMWVTDVEILRLHYAETLRHWRQRFMARREEIAGLYDERFCRMWEFYLVVSEIAFRRRGHMVFQLQLSKRVDAVPLTRDYLGGFETKAAASVRAA